MEKNFAFSFFIALFLFQPSDALACSCGERPTAEDEYKNSSIVFVGRVESIKSSKLRKGQNEILFRALQRFKGFEEEQLGDRVLLYTPEQESLCGYPFLTNTDYLVYATGTPAHFQVALCSRTTILESASEDLRAIEALNTSEENAEE